MLRSSSKLASHQVMQPNGVLLSGKKMKSLFSSSIQILTWYLAATSSLRCLLAVANKKQQCYCCCGGVRCRESCCNESTVGSLKLSFSKTGEPFAKSVGSKWIGEWAEEEERERERERGKLGLRSKSKIVNRVIVLIVLSTSLSLRKNETVGPYGGPH